MEQQGVVAFQLSLGLARWLPQKPRHAAVPQHKAVQLSCCTSLAKDHPESHLVATV